MESKIPVKKQIRLTPAQWEEVRNLWELGLATGEQIAERYGISPTGLAAGIKSKGFKRASRVGEIGIGVKASAMESQKKALDGFSSKRMTRIEETKEQHYVWAESIAKLAVAEVAKANREAIPVAAKHANLKAIKTAAEILEKSLQQRYMILKAGDEIEIDDLPTLEIRELTQDDIIAINIKNSDVSGIDDEDIGELFNSPDDEIIEMKDA